MIRSINSVGSVWKEEDFDEELGGDILANRRCRRQEIGTGPVLSDVADREGRCLGVLGCGFLPLASRSRLSTHENIYSSGQSQSDSLTNASITCILQCRST
jgi:hypothetical protein